MYEYLHSVNLEDLVQQQRGTPCAEGAAAIPASVGKPRPARRIPVMASA
jgi:hypothetical protein